MKSTITLLKCFGPAVAMIGCSGTQHGALEGERQVERHPTMATKDWFVDQWVRENYVYSHPPGSIELEVSTQILSISIRSDGRDVSSQYDISSHVPDFIAGTFTQLDAETLLIGGVNVQSGEGEVFRLALDSNSAVIRSATPEWRGSELSRVSSIAVFPDATRLALLDHALGIVAVYDFASRAVAVVADAKKGDVLRSMKYVSVHKSVAGDDQKPKTIIEVTTVSEPALGAGRLAGKRVTIVDRDGDGLFECVY